MESGHARDLAAAMRRLAAGRANVIIPGAAGLHRKRPRSNFHPTPEFFVQLGGASDFDCPSGKFRLATGDICVMPAGVPHAETPVNLRHSAYRICVVMREKDGLLCLNGESDRSGNIVSRNVSGFSGGGRAFQCLELAALHHLVAPPLRGAYVRGLTGSFLAMILSEMANPSESHGREIPPLVREAERIVRVEIAREALSVAAVAARLGISPDHLTRLFRASHNLPLAAWITRERIQLAKELLVRPERHVSEVAAACGFGSDSYFIKVFRRHEGLTPREWRISSSALRYPSAPAAESARGRRTGRSGLRTKAGGSLRDARKRS